MDNRRKHQRHECSVTAKVHTAFGTFQCSIVDISISGVGIGATHDHLVSLKRDDYVTLEIPEFGVREMELKWTGSGKFGAELTRPLDDQELESLVGR
ncbi:MAG: PilZ domain-containing protein [Hyphomicrobiaceae bacterium]